PGLYTLSLHDALPICRLQAGENPGEYKTRAAAALVEQLGIREEVVELGSLPYRLLHHVYRGCDLYVTSSYAETFAHPLVEAMARSEEHTSELQSRSDL